jgi:kynurenine formamidase
MKKIFYFSTITIMLSSCTENVDPNSVFSKGKWIDLSYDFSPATLYWPNNPTGFKLDTIAEGVTALGFYYSTYAISAPEHGGTHLDAPKHFAKGHMGVDKIPLSSLTGNAVVIDVSAKASQNRDYLISVDDITAYENAHGRIPEGMIVLFRTGYGKFYPDAKNYFGTDERGAGAIPKLHFPGLDSSAATFLVKERKIKAVGLDTPSIDYGQSKDFKSHQILTAADTPIFENVANLDVIPVSGAYIVALPMKIQNGSGAPLRIVAWVKA